MSGYLGTKAVLLSTTAATVTGSSTVGAGLTVDNDGATVLTVDRASTDGTVIDVQKDGTSVGSIGSVSGATAYIDGGAGFSGIQFGGDGLVPRDNGVLADNTSDLGTSSYRFKDLYLSGGVYLGGTGAANHLDDYEEGTFTPQLRGTGSNPTVTYGSSNKGVYIKIGRMVNFVIAMDVSSYSGGSGNAMVTLPFTVQGSGDYSQNYIPFPTAQWGTQINPTRTNLLGRGEAGYDVMIFRSDDSTGSTDEPLTIFPTSGFFIRITGSYTATT